MKANFKNIIILLLLVACFIVGAVMLSSPTDGVDSFKYSDIVDMFENNQIYSFEIDSDGYMTIIPKKLNSDGTPVLGNDGKFVADNVKAKEYRLSWSSQFDEISEMAMDAYREGELVEYNYEEYVDTPWIVSYLPYIIVIAGLVIIWIVMMNQANGKAGGIKKAHSRMTTPDKVDVRFTDVAGAKEEKEELEEVVQFLREPLKYSELGAKIPHGVLLMGPPGTGKTLLARAVAGEAGVPFFSISGSDFVELYVGVGASRVRDLFETARKHPASIVFIDEIDAVGRHRGAGLGGGHDEREQTLNQLLVEMDGFSKHEGIIVIAATNRPDILDPALLRPGRFDRQITVSYPDLEGRLDILKVHAKKKKMGGDVNLRSVAEATVGFTGADLANLLNEAALLTARKGKHLIGMTEVEEATLKVMVGTEKKSTRIKPEEKRKTAYHEAGHAVLAYVLPTQDPVKRISVIPSGRALGYTLNPPVEDKHSVYKNELKEEIAMLLGGRAAEEIVFDDISGGASNDIERATKIANSMVTKYGMSRLGTIRFGSEHSSDEVFLGRDFSTSRNYSEETAAKIDAEIKSIIDEAYENAKRLLSENRERLDRIAEYLVRHEVMDDYLFNALMTDGKSVEELEEMEAERRAKTEEENRREAESAEKKSKKKQENEDPDTEDEKTEEADSENEEAEEVDSEGGDGDAAEDSEENA